MVTASKMSVGDKTLSDKTLADKTLVQNTRRSRRAVDLEPLKAFLGSATPVAWLDQAEQGLDILLIDHANCEKKAASTALAMLYRYTDRPELLDKLSRLAREELRHFEQVLAAMRERQIDYRHVSASRYAAALMGTVSAAEPRRLIDTLIVGAFIEARSCERFAALIPRLDAIDTELADFYHSLLQSEARHFSDYLALAKLYADGREQSPQAGQKPQQTSEPVDGAYVEAQIIAVRAVENALVADADQELRFHSGPLVF